MTVIEQLCVAFWKSEDAYRGEEARHVVAMRSAMAEFARLAQSEEMVERITRRASYVPSDISRGIVRDILAALFHETGVTP
jgi:hypothetical protein